MLWETLDRFYSQYTQAKVITDKSLVVFENNDWYSEPVKLNESVALWILKNELEVRYV